MICSIKDMPSAHSALGEVTDFGALNVVTKQLALPWGWVGSHLFILKGLVTV